IVPHNRYLVLTGSSAVKGTIACQTKRTVRLYAAAGRVAGRPEKDLCPRYGAALVEHFAGDGHDLLAIAGNIAGLIGHGLLQILWINAVEHQVGQDGPIRLHGHPGNVVEFSIIGAAQLAAATGRSELVIVHALANVLLVAVIMAAKD